MAITPGETRLRDGRYVLMKTLGEGSQAETFEAIDIGLGKRVAIKRFRVGKAKAWKDVELAEREAKTLASLEHEHLPRYVEHFEEDGALVLVMDLIEGKTLAELRREGTKASIADVERLLGDASSALAYLHGRIPPVVHRDLKPANVIRRPDGSFVFVDFGAVRDRLKPAGGSTVVGTFGYMAPEQFQGRASAASDVYGIGATVLAFMTGEEPEELPHKGLAIDVVNAVPAGTPRWLVRTLELMLTPDPEQRATSIEEALERGRGRGGPGRGREERGEREEREDRGERGERGEREEVAEGKGRKAARKAARRARKAARRRPRGPVPFLPRLFAGLGLMVAQIVVWAILGLAVPVALEILAIFFGEKPRRALASTRASYERARAAMDRASDRVRGVTDDEHDDEHGEHGEEDEADASRRVRVAPDISVRVRSVTPEQAQRAAMRRAEMSGEDAERWAAERATLEAERWEWEERLREEDERERRREEAEARARGRANAVPDAPKKRSR